MNQDKSTRYRIGKNESPVYVSEALQDFSSHWRHHLGTHNKRNLFVLLDENVELAFPDIISDLFDDRFHNVHIKKLKGGEQLKNLVVATEIWDELSALNADRSWVIVSIGGGTLSDLAGFTASAYKRGIPCVFVPTSLMAMIDASVGGKNALNQGSLKNQIGTYYFPQFVFVFPRFLKSLPEEEYRSGYAELIKHALLHVNNNLWNTLQNRDMSELPDASLLASAIRVKMKIVQTDPFENNKRLFLNFGHSFGHAIESYFIDHNKPVKHGEAVASGMQFALYMSVKKSLIASALAEKLSSMLESIYPFPQNLEMNELINYMRHDKKVVHGKIRIILFKDFGRFKIDFATEEELLVAFSEFIAKKRA
ncbi:MAG: hypothetical protein C0592_13795 [Marinilabiliales bacterium]|nr:MAG: hypothetical protein C0592_13795 [Marinilabiliales bacterium]